MTKKKEVGYRSPPTAHQWLPGQSGNPSGKKKAVKEPPQPLPEIFAAQFYEPSTMTISGKKQMLSPAELLVKTILHNIVKAPIKHQVDALKKLTEIGFFDPQNILAQQQEYYEDPFTEEHRRLLKIIRDEMDGLDTDEQY